MSNNPDKSEEEEEEEKRTEKRPSNPPLGPSFRGRLERPPQRLEALLTKHEKTP